MCVQGVGKSVGKILHLGCRGDRCVFNKNMEVIRDNYVGMNEGETLSLPAFLCSVPTMTQCVQNAYFPY